MSFAWLLNLDAEEELERPGAHTSSARVLERIDGLRDPLAPLLRDDLVVTEGVRADGLRGRAWCPTPSALARLGRAGASLSPAPSLDVLRRVNHRRFSFELGDNLPGARWVESLEDVRVASGTWLLKLPFGFAGRGRVVLTGPMTAEIEARVARALEGGEGAQLEPLALRREDFAMHGFLDAAGRLTAGSLTRQRIDARGAWQGTTREVDAPVEASLREELDRSAEALRVAGYFGPFGIDAFTWEDQDGAVHLHRRSEINARYSMGWAIGMGDARPDLEESG
ncbi:MAG TPA: hypothetical protein VF316_14800 [Polyangiaceae bacterium]